MDEKDIHSWRRDQYAFLAASLAGEPSQELAQFLVENQERLRPASRASGAIRDGWAALSEFVANGNESLEAIHEAILDDYTALFIGPYGKLIQPYESYYLEERFFGGPLEAVKEFLQEVGFEKDDGFREPEDHIAFELECMRFLITKQLEAPDSEAAEAWLTSQRVFLTEHLLKWALRFSDDVAERAQTDFYRGVAQILAGLLQWEQELLAEVS